MLSVEITSMPEAEPGQNTVTLRHAGFVAEITNKSPAWWRNAAAGGEFQINRSTLMDVSMRGISFTIAIASTDDTDTFTYTIRGTDCESLRDQFIDCADQIAAAYPHVW